MLYGILGQNAIERYLNPVGHRDKTPIEIAVHALLVRELYADQKKVYSKMFEPSDKVTTYEYGYTMDRKTCELLELDYEKTIMRIVANDMWSLFQTSNSVTIIDWFVKVDGNTVSYGITYLDED